MFSGNCMNMWLFPLLLLTRSLPLALPSRPPLSLPFSPFLFLCMLLLGRGSSCPNSQSLLLFPFPFLFPPQISYVRHDLLRPAYFLVCLSKPKYLKTQIPPPPHPRIKWILNLHFLLTFFKFCQTQKMVKLYKIRLLKHKFPMISTWRNRVNWMAVIDTVVARCARVILVFFLVLIHSYHLYTRRFGNTFEALF